MQGSEGVTAENSTLTPLGRLAVSALNATGLGAVPKVFAAVTPGWSITIDPPDETSPSDGLAVTEKLKLVYEIYPILISSIIGLAPLLSVAKETLYLTHWF